MSEPRTDTTEDLVAETAATTGNGRHRGPASGDSEASQDETAHPAQTGHGRHRRPPTDPAAS